MATSWKAPDDDVERVETILVELHQVSEYEGGLVARLERRSE